MFVSCIALHMDARHARSTSMVFIMAEVELSHLDFCVTMLVNVS